MLKYENMKISREQFLELYKDLPEELQYAMSSERTIDTTEQLIKEYQLSENHSSVLIEVIGHTLLGVSPPSECAQRLVRAGISKKDAEQISQTVNRVIFFPARRILSELYQEEVKTEDKEGQEKQKTEVSRKKKTDTPDQYREDVNNP